MDIVSISDCEIAFRRGGQLARSVKLYIPQIEVVITPGVGHFNMLEAPEAVSEAIRHFARRVVRRS